MLMTVFDEHQDFHEIFLLSFTTGSGVSAL